MRADDLVATFVRMLQEAHPQTPAREWMRLEVELRREFGGRRCYVLKAATIEREQSAPKRR